MIDPEYIESNRRIGQLRKRLESYMDEARRNFELHLRFQRIELALMAAPDFAGIIDLLDQQLKRDFRLEAVGLALIDRRGEIDAALCPAESPCASVTLLSDHREVLRLQRMGRVPWLGVYQPQEHGWLFAGPPRGPGSIALLPLYRQDECLGCLSLFSERSRRYDVDAATDFQARLAAVTALCIENSLRSEWLRRLGLTDALTGLPNRRELETRLAEELSRAQRDASPLSCLFADIDHFKQINDGYGHDVGDLALQHVAGVMLDEVRRGDVLARFGGEEFVALLPGVDLTAACETAERLRRAVERQALAIDDDTRLALTVSVGIASFHPGSGRGAVAEDAGATLLASADQALYRAKQAGRNRIEIAEDHSPA